MSFDKWYKKHFNWVICSYFAFLVAPLVKVYIKCGTMSPPVFNQMFNFLLPPLHIFLKRDAFDSQYFYQG